MMRCFSMFLILMTGFGSIGCNDENEPSDTDGGRDAQYSDAADDMGESNDGGYDDMKNDAGNNESQDAGDIGDGTDSDAGDDSGTDAGPCDNSSNGPADIFSTNYDALPNGSALPGSWYDFGLPGSITNELDTPCFRHWAKHPAPIPTSGSPDWGVAAEGFRIPPDSEFWFRTRLFLPAGFDARTPTGFLKFMRINNAGPGDTGLGRHDLVINTDLSLQFISEFVDVWTRPNVKMSLETVHTIEIYVKPDVVAVDSGGEGRIRIWLDGVLIADITAYSTVPVGSIGVNQIELFGYWNGADGATPGADANDYPPTPDLAAYTRDEELRTSAAPPSETDANGNLFIGL